MIIFSTLWVGIIILFLMLFGVIFFLVRSLDVNRKYEFFFNNSLKDIDFALIKLGNLLERRQMLAVDPEVQELYKMVEDIYILLTGYSNARKEENKKE
jgi:hypothetical protein